MQFALELPDIKTVVEFTAILLVQELDSHEVPGCEVSLANGTSFFWPGMTYDKWRTINAEFQKKMAELHKQNQSNLILPR